MRRCADRFERVQFRGAAAGWLVVALVVLLGCSGGKPKSTAQAPGSDEQLSADDLFGPDPAKTSPSKSPAATSPAGDPAQPAESMPADQNPPPADPNPPPSEPAPTPEPEPQPEPAPVEVDPDDLLKPPADACFATPEAAFEAYRDAVLALDGEAYLKAVGGSQELQSAYKQGISSASEATTRPAKEKATLGVFRQPWLVSRARRCPPQKENDKKQAILVVLTTIEGDQELEKLEKYEFRKFGEKWFLRNVLTEFTPEMPLALAPAAERKDVVPPTLPLLPMVVDVASKVTTDELAPELKKISTQSEFITDEVIERLTKLKGIEELEFNAPTHVTDAGLKVLATMKSLRKLRIEAPLATEVGLAELAGLNRLTELQLRARVTDQALAGIARIPALTRLEIPYGYVTAQGLIGLKSNRKLERLGLAGNPLGGIDPETLGSITSIRMLDLSRTGIGDAALAEVSKLRALMGLDLSHNPITDNGLESLKSLSNVVEIYLDATQITGPGLAALPPMRKLETVSLRRCRLTTAAIENLLECKGLKKVRLFRSDKLDESSIERLSKHFEGITVEVEEFPQ